MKSGACLGSSPVRVTKMNDPGGVAVSGIFLFPNEKSLDSCGLQRLTPNDCRMENAGLTGAAATFFIGPNYSRITLKNPNEKAGAFASAKS